MKVFLLEANYGDGYESIDSIAGVFLSKKGLYRCMFKLLNECSRKQNTKSWKHESNVVWCIEDEDGYRSTIYSIKEMEVEE